MKAGDAEYLALVEKKRAEIRGNISSVKMSEAETAREIEAITGGAVSTFAPAAGTVADPTRTPITYAKAIGEAPKKRGRPQGSKNKPK